MPNRVEGSFVIFEDGSVRFTTENSNRVVNADSLTTVAETMIDLFEDEFEAE